MPELALQQSQTIKSQVTRPAEHSFEKAGPVYSINPITSYQQAYGNQAVQRMLQAKVVQAKLVVNPPDDEYEREADQVADTVMRMPEPAVQRPASELEKDDEEKRRLQTKSLSIHAVSNIQREVEEEEERIQTRLLPGQNLPLTQRDETEEVPIQTKSFSVNGASIIQREGDEESDEEEKRKEEEETLIQTNLIPGEEPSILEGAEDERYEACPKEKGFIRRKTASNAASQTVDESLLQNLGSGQSLDTKTRNFFEPRFGYDFSSVEVHSGVREEDAAKSINARAFTVGQDIVFNYGQYSPDSHEGKALLAHELTHIVQQGMMPRRFESSLTKGRAISTTPAHMLQRDKDGGIPQPDAGVPVAGEKSSSPKSAYGVSLVGADGILYAGMEFRPDSIICRQLLEQYTVSHGSAATKQLVAKLKSAESSISADKSSMHGVTSETDLYSSLSVRLGTIMPLVTETLTKIESDHQKFVADFEKQAKANVNATLDTSEDTAKREAFRYGLTEEQITVRTGSTRYGEEWERHETKYHMQTGTPTTTGLQEAAKVLLARRENIARLECEQRAATRFERDRYDPEGKGIILVPDEPRYSKLGLDIKTARDEYMPIRSEAASRYPILAAVSDLDNNTDALETIAKKGAGEDAAQIIGAQIAERRANIAKVRDNLNDKSEVNIWRLPPIVDVTSIQLGANTDMLKKRWTTEQVEEEKPGLLKTIALAIFNLLAIALAPVTGGISLAVAAGVNVIATAAEVQEYMMQKALAGTAFDKAKALSQEDPSLFWLAISIIGTAVDVGTAASSLLKTFRALSPLAKTAEIAKSGKEAEESMEALKIAARKEGGEHLEKRVVENVSRTRGGESIALEAAGATPSERKALEMAASAAKSEATGTLVASVRSSAGTEVKISKAGHIFSCTNPCTFLREKHAGILASGAKIKGEATTLGEQLTELEKRSLKAAEDVKAAKNAKEVANATERAKMIAEEIIAFDQKVSRESLKLKKKLIKEQLDRIREGIKKPSGEHFFPEEGLLGGGKHGIEWTEARARAIKEGKPQGVFRRPEDIEHAVEQGRTLGLNKEGTFALPKDSTSVVIMPDGSEVRATRVFVKVYPSGKVHAYPMP